MKKLSITAVFAALAIIAINIGVSGCASTESSAGVSPVAASGRSASRPGPSPAGRRYALVIGNAAYRNIERLENTVNDAEDIAAALKQLGFDVDLKLDITRARFGEAIDAYIARLEGDRNSEGFFWYAGHGVQIRDQNYLLPVDASIESERVLQRDAFSLDSLLADLGGAGNRVNVVILDACRNNPLPSSSRGAGNRGLAAIQDVPGDLFLMFSTAAGDVAADGKGKRNSPFAEAFLRHITSSEPVVLMASDVASETMRLTNDQQKPLSRSSIIRDKYYSLNPERSGGGGAGGGEDQALAFYKEGVLLYSNGKIDRAIADYTEAIRLDPKYAWAYGRRGDAYGMKGDYDQAIADLTEAIRLDPKYDLAYGRRGAAYVMKEDYDRAIADLTEAIRLDPKYDLAYGRRGDAYGMKGDYDRAIADYTEAIRLDPEYDLAYGSRGDAYRMKGDYDRAITDYTEAIRLDPKYVWAYGSRGDAYGMKGDYDRAIADYTEAIQLDPKFEWAKERLEIAKRRGK
jgi:tetratricopeptide (TPR) repeat protein